MFREESEQICNVKVNDHETMMYRVCTESIIMKFYIVLKIVDVRHPISSVGSVFSLIAHYLFSSLSGVEILDGNIYFCIDILIQKHTRPLAQTIFGDATNSQAILDLDGTYIIYIQNY